MLHTTSFLNSGPQAVPTVIICGIKPYYLMLNFTLSQIENQYQSKNIPEQFYIPCFFSFLSISEYQIRFQMLYF